MSATFHAWNMLPPVIALVMRVTTNSPPTVAPKIAPPAAASASRPAAIKRSTTPTIVPPVPPTPKIPSSPSPPNVTANSVAPTHTSGPRPARAKPYLATNIGPPCGSSGRAVSRKSIDCVTSVIFSAMPTTPITHIHSTAPGPPMATASATPPMFPRPTVALRAVDRAWKWLIAPGSSLSSYLPRTTATPWVRARHCPKTVQPVNSRPTSRSA